MRRIVLFFVSVLLISIGIAGCSKTTSAPKGIYAQNGKTYYKIALPSGDRVGDHFELTGNEGTMVATQVDVNGSNGSQDMGTVYYRAVKQGGWVAYDESRSGTILYFPSEFTADHVKLACSSLLRNKGNYMSFEEAKDHISWLE